MEKIAIQFNEFDYQIYHDYCLRYYAILDVARKRALHLFLELFEKELLTVGEHDLGEAVIFFSKKCEDILSDGGSRGEDRVPIDLPLLRVCREVPVLIEDFEKIYRIIEKSGITANFLLLLATFSKISEEERNAYVSAIDENDRRKAESVAPRIADTIQTRLGPGAGWESVLYELTRIIRKYNLVAPDLKIDQNCIYLLGPAVVSHFNVNIGYAEIQATLERYIEERELAAFEALLKNKLYLPDHDTDTDTSDNLIFEVLKSISGGNIDPAYFETVSDPGHPKMLDLPAVISQPVSSHNSQMIPLSGHTNTANHIKIPKKYPSRFAIDIGNNSESLVVLQKKQVDRPYTVLTKPGISQYSVIFMGIIILILFAVTVAATSGIWSPVKPIANSSTGLNSSDLTSILSIVENLQRNSTLSAKNDQTANLRSPPAPTLIVTPVTTKKGITNADVNKHFFAIAFGPDNTKITKRAPELYPISLAIAGDYRDNDTVLIHQFTAQFNNYSSTDKFHSDLKSGEMATIVMWFSPQSSLKNIADLGNMVISKNEETGEIYYLHMTVKVNRISKEVVYINSDLKGERREHWILRGLLDDLGLPGEDADYPDSIFYSGSENTTRLSEMDWKAVQLLYGSKITSGLTSDRVKALLPG